MALRFSAAGRVSRGSAALVGDRHRAVPGGGGDAPAPVGSPGPRCRLAGGTGRDRVNDRVGTGGVVAATGRHGRVAAGGRRVVDVRLGAAEIEQQLGVHDGEPVDGHRVALLAHIVVTYPSGRVETRLERVVVVSIYAVAAFVLLARATTTDFTSSCVRCPANHLYVGGYPDVFHALDAAAVGLLAAVNVAIAATLAAKWRRAGPARRRVLAAPYATLVGTV